jgi:hypothetical protein
VRNKLFRLGTREQLVPNRPRLDRGLVERFAQAERHVARPALLLALESLSQPERGEIPGEAEDAPYIEWYLAGAEEEYREFVLERNDVVRSLFQDYYDADVSLQPGALGAVQGAHAGRRARARARRLREARDLRSSCWSCRARSTCVRASACTSTGASIRAGRRRA